MINLQHLARDSRAAAEHRGIKLGIYEFADKFREEVEEYADGDTFACKFSHEFSNYEEELADIILVALTALNWIGCTDIEKLLLEKLKYNQHRQD